MRKILLILCLLAFCGIANAETVNYTLTWDANSEPDLAGYKVYIGTETGKYDNVIIPSGDAALATTYEGSLEIPDDSKSTFYFAVTAYDISDLESDYSNEVSQEFDTRIPPAAPQNLSWFKRLVAWVFKQLHIG